MERLELTLKDIDKRLLAANSFFDIIPLRVSMKLDLPKPQMQFLRDNADAEDGMIERWLLVPSTMPLCLLSATILIAFGAYPSPGEGFFLPAERNKEIASSFGDLLFLSPYLFNFPVDPGYMEEADRRINDEDADVLSAPYLIPRTPPELLIELRDEILRPLKGKIGRKALQLAPLSDETFAEVCMKTGYDIGMDLALTLPIGWVIGRRNRKLISADKIISRYSKHYHDADNMNVSMAPLTHSLIYISGSGPVESKAETFTPYKFEITVPNSIQPLLDDGYTTLSDYFEAITYVLSTGAPDCIARRGYGLYGECQEDFYDFITEMKTSGLGLADAAEAFGWQGLSLDPKLILR